MIHPWMHAPISHQMAFKAKMQPASNFNAPTIGGSPIHEKVKPRQIGSQAHSAVKSPGMKNAPITDDQRDQALAAKLQTGSLA